MLTLRRMTRVLQVERANSIEVESLVREFKNGPRAVDGINLRVDGGMTAL